jgi:hypothetical protein
MPIGRPALRRSLWPKPSRANLADAKMTSAGFSEAATIQPSFQAASADRRQDSPITHGGLDRGADPVSRTDDDFPASRPASRDDPA